MSLKRDKALPDIPHDVVIGLVGDEVTTALPPARSASNANKILPAINIEKTLSGEEMDRLHELWNGAALSARAHRKRQGGQRTPLLRVPAPISIPDPENMLPMFPSTTPSMTTPSTPGSQKRWGFLSARKLSDAQKSEKKATSALEILRSKAQQRLMKKLTKSTPNLVGEAKAAAAQPGPSATEAAMAVLIPSPKANNATVPPTSSLPPKPRDSQNQEMVDEPEEFVPDPDDTGIYFTMDPNWRASRGSEVMLMFISPIPGDDDPMPDSPLLHRPHSLGDLSLPFQTPEPSGSDHPAVVSLHPIDELHSYLDFDL
ncbi:hypothetical protein HYDPIDRAFT_166428 [Hydnomerulius pinastri MD-312]|nr:hypothetical protein HYDPIDRAFT_166428 [Hydnomerulius pinastri MD-312]